MKIKFITSDIFSSNNILVRIKPLSSEENIRYSADISSSNVKVDIDKFVDTFGDWKDLRRCWGITLDCMRYGEIYNFSDNEKVLPIVVYDISKKNSEIDTILIPIENIFEMANYENDTYKDKVLTADCLREFIAEYSARLFMIRRSIYALDNVYTSKFLSTLDFKYPDSRITKKHFKDEGQTVLEVETNFRDNLKTTEIFEEDSDGVSTISSKSLTLSEYSEILKEKLNLFKNVSLLELYPDLKPDTRILALKQVDENKDFDIFIIPKYEDNKDFGRFFGTQNTSLRERLKEYIKKQFI